MAEDEQRTMSVLLTKNAIAMPIEDMKVIKDVQELANVKFDIIEVQDEGASEKINLMISSGELPEFFLEGVDKSSIITYYGQDVFIPVTQYINEETMPNLYKIMTENPGYYAACTATDGEIWGIPRIEEMFGLVCKQGILSINQDWLTALGLEMPTTIDEFKNCLIAFCDNDCNGNGDTTDEIPFMFIIGSSSIGSYRNNTSIGQFFGCWGQADAGDRMALDADGKVICTATTNAYKEGLKWFNELYNEGLIWADFGLNDSAAMMSALNSDECIVGAVVQFFIMDNVPWDRRVMYSAVPYLQGPGGEYGCKDNISEMHNTVQMAITTACKDPEFAAKMIDLFYDPVRGVETNWDPIGMYYKLDENGVMVWNRDDPLPEGIDTYSQLRVHTTLGNGTVMNEYYDTVVAYPEDAVDLYNDMIKVGFVEKHLNDAIIPPNMWYSTEDQDTMSLISSNIYNIIDNYNATAILDGNVDETWDAYIASLDAAGLATYLDIVQRNYDAYDHVLDTYLACVDAE